MRGRCHEQAGFAFGDRDRAQVDAARYMNGGARVSEGDGDVDAVLLGVDGAERGPAQVIVHAESLPGVVGLVE